jgi:MFS family permease
VRVSTPGGSISTPATAVRSGGQTAIVIAGVVFSAAMGGPVFYALGAFFEPIQSEFHWSYTTVSWAYSLQALGMGGAMVFGGVIMDRVSPIRFAFGGIAIVVGSFLALSQIHSAPALYLVFVVMGIGAAPTAYLLFNSLLALWFPARMGAALAFVQVGFGLGGLAVPGFVALILSIGWRAAAIVIAIAIVLFCVPASLFLSKPLVVESSRPSLIELDPPTNGEQVVLSAAHRATQSRSRSVIGLPTFWVILVVLMGSLGVAQVIYTHQIRALINFGVEPAVAGVAIGIAAAAGVFGRFGLGWMADRYGSRYILVLALVLQSVGVGILAMIHGSADPLLYVFAVTFGVGQGAIFLLGPMIQREFFGVRSFGTVQGLLLGPTSLTSAVAPLLVGMYVDRYGDYRPTFIVASASVMLMAIILALIGRSPQSAAASGGNSAAKP